MRKKILKRFLFCFICLVFALSLFSGCSREYVLKQNSRNLNTYNINLKIGEELTLEIDNVLSESEQEDYYYCPYCNAELG